MELVLLLLNGPLIKKRMPTKKRSERVRLRFTMEQVELRRLVAEWRRSGPNVRKLFLQEPALAAFAKMGRIDFYPTESGRGHLEWSPGNTEEGISPPEEVAQERFMMLITNPNWEALGGPCLSCQDFFLKSVLRPRSYCSIKCSSKSTATRTMKNKRQWAHKEKIKKAQVRIDKWKPTIASPHWKKAVADGVEFTARGLTRWVNNGELKPPVSDNRKI
jgi:hypothetical protein